MTEAWFAVAGYGRVVISSVSYSLRHIGWYAHYSICKFSKILKKLLKLENTKKDTIWKNIQIDSELTRIYRPISCITDSNQLISAESEWVVADMIISTIRGSVSSVSVTTQPICIGIGRYGEPWYGMVGAVTATLNRDRTLNYSIQLFTPDPLTTSVI